MDLSDRFYCGCCDVVFREKWPKFADVTPCPGCDCDAVCLTELRAHLSIDHEMFYDLYDL